MISNKRASSFFQRIIKELPESDLNIVVVTHILPDKVEFLQMLSRIGKIVAVIPKQKSIDRRTLENHAIRKE